MGILDKVIGSVFEVEQETQVKPEIKQTATPTVSFVSSSTVIPTSHTVIPSSYVPINNEDREKVLTLFKKHFDGLNDPKPSYHEVKDMVTQFIGNGIDINTAFKAAYSGFKTQGLTIDTLVSTTQSTLTSIENFIKSFNENANAKYSGIIESKQAENARFEQEIVELTNQIQQKREAITTNSIEIERAKTEVVSKTQLFNEIGNQYIQTIKNDLNLIQTING